MLITGGMPRPPLPRRVCCSSGIRGFRPIGRPVCRADVLSLGRDELEAIRLSDVEGLYQEAAAERMGVSRQTFARVLAKARTTVGRSLVEGMALIIEPGAAVDGPKPPQVCPIHGGDRRLGRQCRCGGSQCRRGEPGPGCPAACRERARCVARGDANGRTPDLQ